MRPLSMKITKSNKPKKRYKALFKLENGKKKTIHFGSSEHSNYTIHKDKERKKRYINRHKKRENWNDPLSAGSLSRYILWEKPNLNDSIKFFKSKFGIK